MAESIFNKLNAIDVSGKTEKKKDLTYLSWCWAWAEVKKLYPDANYNIRRFGENNLPYVFDEKTGYMVFTDVTIEGITHEMWLPVMDGANKAMKAEPYTYKTKYDDKTCDAADMFDVNKAIMRCLTKNLAMFGLGLYIYAGEDLPEESKIQQTEKEKEEAEKQLAEKEALAKLKQDVLALCKEKVDGGADKETLYGVIANITGKKNPNAIKDIETAEKVLDAIKNIGVENNE